MTEKRTAKNECYSCKHRRSIPGDAHIACANPDMTIKGNRHGISHGWFMYPFNYDPVWKDSSCNNFEEGEAFGVVNSNEMAFMASMVRHHMQLR